MRSFLVVCTIVPLCVNAFKWHAEREEVQEEAKASVCPRYNSKLEDDEFFRTLMKRQTVSTGGGGVDAGGTVGVGNVTAGVGPISAGIGNINITVGNVTVEAGDITVEDIHIGDITILVSVALEASSATPTGTIVGTAIPSTSIATSTGTSTTLSSSATTISVTPSATSTDGSAAIIRRQDTTPTLDPTVSVSLPSATATVSAGVGDIGVNVGSVGATVGNITLTVGNILVKLGNIEIKNVTIGNILVAVQIGQPSNNGSLLQNLIGATPTSSAT